MRVILKFRQNPGIENPADLMTKILGNSDIVSRLARMGLVLEINKLGEFQLKTKGIPEDDNNVREICAVDTTSQYYNRHLGNSAMNYYYYWCTGNVLAKQKASMTMRGWKRSHEGK